jgi:hypothetical protein
MTGREAGAVIKMRLGIYFSLSPGIIKIKKTSGT